MERWGRQEVSSDNPVHTSSLDSAAMDWHATITMAWCLRLTKLRFVCACVFWGGGGGGGGGAMTAPPLWRSNH